MNITPTEHDRQIYLASALFRAFTWVGSERFDAKRKLIDGVLITHSAVNYDASPSAGNGNLSDDVAHERTLY